MNEFIYYADLAKWRAKIIILIPIRHRPVLHRSYPPNQSKIPLSLSGLNGWYRPEIQGTDHFRSKALTHWSLSNVYILLALIAFKLNSTVPSVSCRPHISYKSYYFVLNKLSMNVRKRPRILWKWPIPKRLGSKLLVTLFWQDMNRTLHNVIELVLHFKVLAGNMHEPGCSEVSVLNENNPEQEEKSDDMNTNILDISNDRCSADQVDHMVQPPLQHHASSSSIYFDCQEY